MIGLAYTFGGRSGNAEIAEAAWVSSPIRWFLGIHNTFAAPARQMLLISLADTCAAGEVGLSLQSGVSLALLSKAILISVLSVPVESSLGSAVDSNTLCRDTGSFLDPVSRLAIPQAALDAHHKLLPPLLRTAQRVEVNLNLMY